MVSILARDLVAAHLYDSEDAVIQDALRLLVRSRPDVRVRLAVHQYRTGDLSLAKAAALAGVSWAQMGDILRQYGVEIRLGPVSIEAAIGEVETLRQALKATL